MGEYFRGWRRKAALMTLAIALTLSAITVQFAVACLRKSHIAAKDSAQLALLAESQKRIEDYYSTHGQFPETFPGLPSTDPDGGDARLLSEFQYERHGDECRISVRTASTGRVDAVRVRATTTAR